MFDSRKIKDAKPTLIDDKDIKPFRGELYNIDQLKVYAKKVASTQQVIAGTGSSYLLNRLNHNEKIVQEFNNYMLSGKKEQYIAPAVEWLIDNFYLIEEHIRLARRHFPKSYYRELPCVRCVDSRELPRIYDVITRYVTHVDSQIEEDSLSGFFYAFQDESQLKIGELWAVPIMLRLVLIENIQRIASRLKKSEENRQLAEKWIEKLESAAEIKNTNLVEVIAAMDKSHPDLNSSFVAEFSKRLVSRRSSLNMVKNWLEEKLDEQGFSVDEMLQIESRQQAADQLSVSNSIKGLRFLNDTDWRKFVERLSKVDETLRKDPAGVYCRMDFATRDKYRHAVEHLAHKSLFTETAVGELVLQLAKKAYDTHDDIRKTHVGYYLIDDGLKDVKKNINYKHNLRSAISQKVRRFPLLIYSGSIIAISLLGMWGFMAVMAKTAQNISTGWFATISIIFLLCFSQFAVFIVNWLITLIMKPHLLPRLDFTEEIAPDCHTIVVIPCMITRESSIDKLLSHLEIHYLSNRDRGLYFALLTDFTDADTQKNENDKKLLEYCRNGVEKLNIKYNTEDDTLFFLFHRERKWNAREKKWMGYERKRGKLKALNRFLLTGDESNFDLIEGNISVLKGVIRYVITLDADTQLPPETAHKLIGTMAHPLNRPVFDAKKNVVKKGYGILQPRVGISMSSSKYSIFSGLFAGETGIDPYTRSVSDVYQDLFQEGSFIGKGIYNVEAFEKTLDKRFPENRILSHDLIESAYARSALVTDVEIYEHYPSGYLADAKRRHRWIRGDWQLLRWLFPRVPEETVHARNPISGACRWKIADNLRRSLFPVASLLFFVLFCFLFPGLVWAGAIFLIGLIVLPSVISLISSVIRKSEEQSWKLHIHETLHKSKFQLEQHIFSLVTLPFDAYLSADAIVRTSWRLLVSKINLLQWQTSADVDRKELNSLSNYYKEMWFSPFFAVICALLLGWSSPVFFYALPFFIVWLISPYIAWKVSCPSALKKEELKSDDYKMLHRIARKIWFFFEEFVTEKENWLPPDNFQEVPVPVVANRTSPTNIGLYLLSNLSAYDFGYISLGGLIERTNNTFRTLTEMKKYKGHFYNWYDTRTLMPLEPFYISTVDSGNLAGHLITLGQGLKEVMEKPVYSPVIFEGLRDTVNTMTEFSKDSKLLNKIYQLLTQRPATISGACKLLQALYDEMQRLKPVLETESELMASWVRAFIINCEDHLKELYYLAPWVDLIHKTSLEHINKITHGKYQQLIFEIISLLKLNPALSGLLSFQKDLDTAIRSLYITMNNEYKSGEIFDYFSSLSESCRKIDERAKKRIHILNILSHECESFSNMDFTFLYNNEKKLFTIGYNVQEEKSDLSYYDMLASEARLSSFIAIAQGQVPQEHWFSLSRLLLVLKGKPVLLSWSGSMFEYLMPLLVMPDFEETLLHRTYKSVIEEQIEYTEKFNVPWGISESGYNRTDTHFNFQYQAFGIPSLGLKRGLSKELVIAPYASLLALMVSPKKACKNLHRLTKEGREGNYGYYEAIDYTTSHLPKNKKSITIRSFMAHHQGMSLLALDNLLFKNNMQKRFGVVPMIKAYELLLQERIPQSIIADVISDDSNFEIKGQHPLDADVQLLNRIYHNTNIHPEVNVLSNGQYQVMINHNGSGYSRWNNMALTRWREDPTRDNHGLFIYFREPETGTYWSSGFQPSLQATGQYEVNFTQAYAEFRHQQVQFDINTTICVSPEDDIELRCIKIKNTGNKGRRIEVTSYAEVVISSQDADEAHQVFNNLFVQTYFHRETEALICSRRARSQNEKPPYVVHLLLTNGQQDSGISYETDRNLFTGRTNDLAYPQSMQQGDLLSGSTGAVLDPIVSIRRTIYIPAGMSATVCVALGVSDTENGALSLAYKYQNINMIDRAFNLAWTRSQVVLYQLNITESEAQLYNRLSGSLIYLNPSYRAEQAILKHNRKGQSGLWGYSISGDFPIVVVRISNSNGMILVQQMISAHTYWRLKGITVELIILNEDSSVYRHPLHDEIIGLITTGTESSLLDKKGGIFVRSVDQIPGEDLILLQSVARIVLTDKLGSLEDQMEKITKKDIQVSPLKIKNKEITYSKDALDTPEIIYNNGYGGFSRDGKEYIITVDNKHCPPAPWCNVIANKYFGTLVSESGSSYTWAENAHEFRLTAWYNDPVQDTTGEAVYIRDEEDGRFWSPSPLPVKSSEPYIIRHGFGYSVFRHIENGIESELTIYVAIDAPVKFSVLTLRNVSPAYRRLTATAYYELVLGEKRSKNLQHIQTDIDTKSGVIYARNYYNQDFAGKIAFLDAGLDRTVTASRREFLGSNGSLSNPVALGCSRLSGKVGAGIDPCFAAQINIELAPGEEKTVSFKLGFAHHKDQMQHLIYRFRERNQSSDMLQQVKAFWEDKLGVVSVETEDASLNYLTNGWLLYQTLSCRIWGRSGFYQSGGAYGFRDQLQDTMAMLYSDPQITREQLMLAAHRQFAKGDVQHWWHPPVNRGVRTQFSDDYLWLPYVAHRYISITDDISILDEVIPFIEGRELRPEEESYYDLPWQSEESATFYEHCVRSIRYGLKFGEHGLPLMGCGDWNDGMNMVGIEGKGESVWLAFFLYDVLVKFSSVAKMRNDDLFSDYCLEEAEKLKRNISLNAWDGGWYRRAYFDNGTPLGSVQNNECCIDSIPQSWSLISQGGDKERSISGMEQLNKQLVDRNMKLIRLFTPAFDKGKLNPGYIKGYIPGVRENGGQYTHAAIWAVWAMALMGDAEKAWELFDIINPVNHGRTPEDIAVYKVEPYVVAADVYSSEQHPGRGGWTWYTGSSSWMYRLIIEMLLGMNKVGERLYLKPLLRKEWKKFHAVYRYRNTEYRIVFMRNDDNSEKTRLVVNGVEQQEKDFLILADDGKVHNVELWI